MFDRVTANIPVYIKGIKDPLPEDWDFKFEWWDLGDWNEGILWHPSLMKYYITIEDESFWGNKCEPDGKSFKFELDDDGLERLKEMLERYYAY